MKNMLVKIDWYMNLNNVNKRPTYSPCRTIVSSISTFLFEAVPRAAVRERFVDIISGTGGVGFSFKTEDLLPTEAKTI